MILTLEDEKSNLETISKLSNAAPEFIPKKKARAKEEQASSPVKEPEKPREEVKKEDSKPPAK